MKIIYLGFQEGADQDVEVAQRLLGLNPSNGENEIDQNESIGPLTYSAANEAELVVISADGEKGIIDQGAIRRGTESPNNTARTVAEAVIRVLSWTEDKNTPIVVIHGEEARTEIWYASQGTYAARTNRVFYVDVDTIKTLDGLYSPPKQKYEDPDPDWTFCGARE